MVTVEVLPGCSERISLTCLSAHHQSGGYSDATFSSLALLDFDPELVAASLLLSSVSLSAISDSVLESSAPEF